MTYKELLQSSHASAIEIEEAKEKQLIKAYKQALKEVQAMAAEWAAKLPNYDLAEARKYDRLGKLEAEIRSELARLQKTETGIVTANQYNAVQQGFYGLQWATEQALSTSLVWGGMSTKAIEAAVYNEFSGSTFIKTISKNYANRIEQIFSTLTRSLATGAGYRKTAPEIGALFDKGAWQALRVLRTEGQKAFSMGQLESFEHAKAIGIELREQWVATLDGRTRDAHGKLDGQFREDDGFFHMDGVNYLAPGISDGDGSTVINCRCDLVAEIADHPAKYRRDPTDKDIRVTGLEDIKEYKTFAEWAEPLGWSPETGWPK